MRAAYTKVSIETEDLVWRLRSQGMLLSAISEMTGLRQGLLSRIVRRRMRRQGQAVRFNRGHSFLSAEQVEEIRERHRRGESCTSIARDFDLTPTSIRNCALRRTYKEVPDAPRTALTTPKHNPFSNRLMAS